MVSCSQNWTSCPAAADNCLRAATYVCSCFCSLQSSDVIPPSPLDPSFSMSQPPPGPPKRNALTPLAGDAHRLRTTEPPATFSIYAQAPIPPSSGLLRPRDPSPAAPPLQRPQAIQNPSYPPFNQSTSRMELGGPNVAPTPLGQRRYQQSPPRAAPPVLNTAAGLPPPPIGTHAPQSHPQPSAKWASAPYVQSSSIPQPRPAPHGDSPHPTNRYQQASPNAQPAYAGGRRQSLPSQPMPLSQQQRRSTAPVASTPGRPSNARPTPTLSQSLTAFGNVVLNDNPEGHRHRGAGYDGLSDGQILRRIPENVADRSVDLVARGLTALGLGSSSGTRRPDERRPRSRTRRLQDDDQSDSERSRSRSQGAPDRNGRRSQEYHGRRTW